MSEMIVGCGRSNGTSSSSTWAGRMVPAAVEESVRKFEDSLERVLGRSHAVTQVHVQALDSVVSVNGYFTVAVFIGMAFTTPTASTASLADTGKCKAPSDTQNQLMVLEVVAFSCYLFSTLIAQAVKLIIILRINGRSRRLERQSEGRINDHHATNLLNVHNQGSNYTTGNVNSLALLRLAMLVSALGTIAGTLFLTLSITKIVDIRLGLMSCGSSWASAAIVPLVILVSCGLLTFITAALYSFLFSS